MSSAHPRPGLVALHGRDAAMMAQQGMGPAAGWAGMDCMQSGGQGLDRPGVQEVTSN